MSQMNSWPPRNMAPGLAARASAMLNCQLCADLAQDLRFNLNLAQAHIKLRSFSKAIDSKLTILDERGGLFVQNQKYQKYWDNYKTYVHILIYIINGIFRTQGMRCTRTRTRRMHLWSLANSLDSGGPGICWQCLEARSIKRKGARVFLRICVGWFSCWFYVNWPNMKTSKNYLTIIKPS